MTTPRIRAYPALAAYFDDSLARTEDELHAERRLTYLPEALPANLRAVGRDYLKLEADYRAYQATVNADRKARGEPPLVDLIYHSDLLAFLDCKAGMFDFAIFCANAFGNHVAIRAACKRICQQLAAGKILRIPIAWDPKYDPATGKRPPTKFLTFRQGQFSFESVNNQPTWVARKGKEKAVLSYCYSDARASAEHLAECLESDGIYFSL